MMQGTIPFSHKRIDKILGARILLEGWDPSLPYDISLENGKIKEVVPHEPGAGAGNGDKLLDATNHLIAPSLCHAHIHLDKCFLLTDPKYSDLEIEKGDFTEALELTSKAKARFETDDLIRRGQWLIAESIAAGVTHMRAFVEVDHIVEFKCLDAAVELKNRFAMACEIQICAFAQEPILSGEYDGENRKLMKTAIENPHVEVVGTTPYVEDSTTTAFENMQWAIQMAMENDKHLDLHLDYNIDPEQGVQTLQFVDIANDAKDRRIWRERKTMALGHCTRLTLMPQPEWLSLSDQARDLPLHFIGLPTSDIYMRGKPNLDDGGGERFRGTLQIPQMIQQYNFRGAISINNVGNAFTPQGSCDPLSTASMGVGLYHAGTKADAQLLYECVSTRAKDAIGYPSHSFASGEEANFVLFENGDVDEPISRKRGRRMLQDAVYDPPKKRRTVFRGCVITA